VCCSVSSWIREKKAFFAGRTGQRGVSLQVQEGREGKKELFSPEMEGKKKGREVFLALIGSCAPGLREGQEGGGNDGLFFRGHC